ncbi:MAG: NADH-quinone oxidoreductase subunit N [Phycisphaeraceae bacterium]
MTEMVAKFATLWPEIALLVGACLCLVTGLSPSQAVRNATVWVAAASLVAAALLVPVVGVPDIKLGLGPMTVFVKLTVVGVGLVLLLVTAGVPASLKQVAAADRARRFEPGDTTRGEFFAFFLFSLTGLMLAASADDLVWLFLALELVSLPTYVMVATSRDRVDAQEAAVKYFFLGALSVAVFLYGFALIYGATGFTQFAIHNADGELVGGIAAVAQAELAVGGTLSPLLMTGLVLAVLGIAFKIAAVPMHFYAADVYQGANGAVTAFLAFVPKFAGFIAIIILLTPVGWPLPWPLMAVLWAMAALTMTAGNVLALLQTNVKRVLAYSSVAHSGYALVGVLAGPAAARAADGALSDGIAAVLFYLIAYGVGTIAAFAVLGSLRARGDEAQTYDDLAGLRHRQPGLAAIMVIAVLSLLGLPPLVGFVGKLYIIGAAFSAQFDGYIWLIVLLVLNSAVSAAYYLRIASVCFFGRPDDAVQALPLPSRRTGAAVAGLAAIVLGIGGAQLVDMSATAASRVGEFERFDMTHPAADADPANPATDAPATAARR